MSTHRFFLPDALLAPAQPVDLTPLAHQLARVLRLQPGDHIVLLDGHGGAFTTRIDTLDARTATGTVLSAATPASEPRVRLTLYQCSLKADKFEWVLQKGTELGVARFVPVISTRSVVRPAAALLKKYARWQSILREAAEQSGRTRLPALAPPLDFSDAVTQERAVRFLPWEDAAHTVASTAAPLGALVAAQRPTELALLIGPEGGITRDEAAHAQAHGWQPVTLGPRILRAETAALAAVTVALERLDELAGAPGVEAADTP